MCQVRCLMFHRKIIMYFNAKISVTIADKIVQTVANVAIENDSTELGSKCIITVPLMCRVGYKDGRKDFLTTYPQTIFSAGDPVTITAWYEGFPKLNIFNGFVTDFIEGTPMQIVCTDDVYLLNQTTVSVAYKSISLKDLATNILKGTGVSLILPTLELQLQNISFRLMSPAAIFEWLKKELGINISLSGNQLYINVASNTQTAITYRSDRNIIKCDLQKPSGTWLKFKVRAYFIRENGTKDVIEVGDATGHVNEVYYYKVPRNLATYNKLAAEALNKVKMRRFAGSIETYLYPNCNVFDKAVYTDVRYPDRSGNYVITAVHFDIGRGGYHRKLKWAYLSDLIT